MAAQKGMTLPTSLSAKDAATKAVASETAPKLQEHLSMAQQVAGQTGRAASSSSSMRRAVARLSLLHLVRTQADAFTPSRSWAAYSLLALLI